MLASLLALEAVVLPRSAPRGAVGQRGGFMVALMVPPEMEHAVARSGGWIGGPGGETWDDPLHYTVSYVPRAPGRFERVVSVVRKVASKFPAFEMSTTRAGFFAPPDDKLVHWVGGAAPELHALVGALRSSLDADRIPHDLQYPMFEPHCTIEYIETPDHRTMTRRMSASLQEPAVKFVPRLAVVDDDRRVDVEWSKNDAAPARRAA